MSQSRQMPSPATPGSQVLQVPENQPLRIPGTLRLRGEDHIASSNISNEGVSSRHIRWSEDVVDNEGMGKKRSKGEIL